MGSQVEALKVSNIPVATINSNTQFADRDEIIKDLSCGEYIIVILRDAAHLSKGHPTTRLLYVTPELVLTESFRRVLGIIYSQGELARIAIDEAHCISEWGHEFRPAYCHLSHFRANYPLVPIICLTATATPSVRADVINTLGLISAKTKMFITSTKRQNLHYHVRFTSDESDQRFDWFVSFVQDMYTRRANDRDRSKDLENGRTEAISGIIYVSFRSDCDALSSRLRSNNIGAAPYHAGLNRLERAECQRKWLENTPGFSIIVATTAFGMGIDKQDVRFVVHWHLPKSFEGYYQEAGRAGRDGKAALCVLFYSREDRDRVGHRIAQGNGNREAGASNRNKEAKQAARAASFKRLVEYCEQVDRCRHIVIGEFFDESNAQPCDRACDFCLTRPGELSLRRRRDEGLSSEEWVSTQRERSDFYGEDYI